MKNGEPLRNRWSAFLAGVARDGEIRLVERDSEGAELGFLYGVREAIGDAAEVRYAATREFDEMIMRGRFTNARRAHEPVPFYPALPDADLMYWRNVFSREDRGYPRADDVASRDVSATYYGRGRPADPDLVMIPLLRDVAELILAAGDPDELCRTWCELVLIDSDFAREEIFAGE